MTEPNRPMTAKPRDFNRALKSFLKSIKPWRWQLIIVAVLACIATALTIFGPMILGTITTTAVTSLSETGSVDWEPIAKAAILLIILYIISSILSYIEGLMDSVVAARYTKNLREQILAKISRLPISYFDKVQFGDVLSRMTNDIETIATALSEEITHTVTSITSVVGILIMMFTISIPLSLVAIIIVPISLTLVSRIMNRSQKHFRAQRKQLGKLNSIIEEDYTGSLVIKANSHGPRSIADFERTNRALYNVSWRAQFFGSLAFPLVHSFANLSYIAICILGGHLAIARQITIGNVQAFIQYVNQFNRPITEIAGISATVAQVLAASERIFDFLNDPEEAADPEPAQIVEKVKGDVEFHHVKFSYDKITPVIKDFSCQIPAGSRVAIVGPTGAGKTTIVSLLMRFYDVDSGYITIDGVPTKEMRRNDVRALFGMVLQDTWLFSGSVADNLRYGKPSATLDEVKNSAKTTGVHHFIESLPHDYYSPIDEDSDNISAGEKQLLTIARAMVANPPMIILDEATSNVDTRTEQLIQDAFNQLTKGRTSFVIAHRLSTIRESDIILVMRDGDIVEQGTHEQLLKTKGFYAELYNSQFNGTI